MSLEVLDPTYDDAANPLDSVERLASLEGTTVGIVSNGKKGTATFFAEVERALRQDHGVAEVVLVRKPDYSAPAGAETMDAARFWHALIAGIGD